MKENVLLNIFHRSLVQSNENKIKRNGADEKKGLNDYVLCVSVDARFCHL